MGGQHQNNNYMEQGGNKNVIESGGEIEVQTGGVLDLQSGSTITEAGTVTQTGTRTVETGGSIVLESGATLVAESGALVDQVAGATFVIGAEAANVINVGIVLTDALGVALAVHAHVRAYLSDTVTTGAGIAGTAPATSVAIGTDGFIISEDVSKQAWQLQSNIVGAIDLDITETGTDTWYLVVVLPNGLQIVSGAITFAA